jgi:hypothetical protein
VTFKLTPESVRQAVLEGTPASAIVADLEAAAAHGVPQAVARAIHDWAGNVGRCTVSTAMVVRFDDEALAARASAALGGTVERVGPTTLIVAGDRAHEADGLLAKAGFPPRASGDDDDPLDDGDDLFADDEVDDGIDDGQDEVGAPPIGRAIPHVGRDEGDRVARALGLRPTRAEAPNAGVVEEVRSARTGRLSRNTAEHVLTASGSGGGSPPTRWLARAATGAEAVSKTLLRAAQADADVAVVLRDGSQEIVRLRGVGPRPGFPAELLRAYIYSTGAERQLPADAVVSALALYGTSRNVSRNHPCPCGSSHKFKRCCLKSEVDLAAELSLEQA